MFRFTIRDVLWLTVVVALAVSWWLEHRHYATQTEAWINLPDGGRVLVRPLGYPDPVKK
jgi:hypothetical protein